MRWMVVFLSLLPVVARGHEGQRKLPLSAPESGMSVYQLDSRWTEANGKDIRMSDLKGISRLVVMLYTECQSSCPIVVEDLRGIMSSLPESQRNKLAVTLFTVDSGKETAASLRQFAEQRKLPSNWRLFRGSKSEVSVLAAALGFRYKRLKNEEYVHSNVIYLLDEKGEIVAHKEGLKTPRHAFVKEIQSLL